MKNLSVVKSQVQPANHDAGYFYFKITRMVVIGFFSGNIKVAEVYHPVFYFEGRLK